MRSLRSAVLLGVILFASSGFSSFDAETSKRSLTPVQTVAPTGSARVETTTYNSWTVSCRELLPVPSRKSCSGLLRVIDQNQRPLMTWVIGLDKDGKLTAALRTPTGVTLKDSTSGATFTGILIKNGVDLKLGNAAVRHLPYVSCEPQWCEASIPMGDEFVGEALAAANAVVTIYALNGRAVSYPALPLKGIDKAIFSVRRRSALLAEARQSCLFNESSPEIFRRSDPVMRAHRDVRSRSAPRRELLAEDYSRRFRLRLYTRLPCALTDPDRNSCRPWHKSTE